MEPILLFAIFYLGLTIYTANKVELGDWRLAVLHLLLYIGVMMIFLLAFIPYGYLAKSSPVSDLTGVSDGMVYAIMIFTITAGSLSTGTVNFQSIRLMLARLIPGFKADSAVHTTALVLMALLSSTILTSFISSGGQAGVAESIETTGIDPLVTLSTMALEVTAAVMGVGYMVRRSGRQTLQRLGLQRPTGQQILKGTGYGIGLYFLSVIFALVWTSIVSPEQLQEQTQAARQVSLAINTLPIALIMAFSASVGEEIFIRGALQPVFGIFLSSAFFTLMHTQYLISPTLLFIFFVSISFGLLRQRVNTTTAIIAHFVYNFLPFMLIALAGSKL